MHFIYINSRKQLNETDQYFHVLIIKFHRLQDSAVALLNFLISIYDRIKYEVLSVAKTFWCTNIDFSKLPRLEHFLFQNKNFPF